MLATTTISDLRLGQQIPKLLIAAVFVTFVLLLARILAVDSPVMASDEYAYLANAAHVDEKAELYRLDPGLQSLDTKLYPFLYDAWTMVSEERAQTVGRVFNALLFALCAFVLYATFIRLFDRGTALLSALLYLAMPFSFYSTTLLPEVELQLCLYLLAYCLVVAGTKLGYGWIVAGALFAGLGYLFKPHGVAAILAGGAYLLIVGFFSGRGSVAARAIGAFARSSAFFVLSFAVVLACKKLIGTASDAPGETLVSGIYASYLQRLGSTSYLWENLHGMLDYVGGHIWVLTALFAPGLYALCLNGSRWLRKARNTPTGEPQASTVSAQHFAVFVILLAVALISMIAAFTQSAGSTSEFEKYRLHGRYLESLLPFLLAYSLWWCRNASQKIPAALGMIALASFAWQGRRLYKLYPWDYPDIFGFFTPSLTHWGLPGASSWTCAFILVVGLFCWASLFFGRAKVLAYAIYLSAVFAASHVQMSNWLQYHNQANGPTVDAADGLKDFLGPVPDASGLVLASNRYGETAYLLMEMNSLQYVMPLPADGSFGAKQVPPGVGWIVAPQSAAVDLPSAAELSFGNQKLYLLDSKYKWPVVGEKRAWDKAPIEVGMSAAGSGALHGFNPAEEWGSWSAIRDAYVDLPAQVAGRIRIEFFGWVVDQHPDALVTVSMGDASKELRLTRKGADYSMVLETSVPAERIYFKTSVVRAPQDPRGLGVALSRVKLTSEPGGQQVGKPP